MFSSHSPSDSPVSIGSVHIGWALVRPYGSLNRMSPISLSHLNGWFPVGGAVLRGLESMASLEKVCLWERVGFEASAPVTMPAYCHASLP